MVYKVPRSLFLLSKMLRCRRICIIPLRRRIYISFLFSISFGRVTLAITIMTEKMCIRTRFCFSSSSFCTIYTYTALKHDDDDDDRLYKQWRRYKVTNGLGNVRRVPWVPLRFDKGALVSCGRAYIHAYIRRKVHYVFNDLRLSTNAKTVCTETIRRFFFMLAKKRRFLFITDFPARATMDIYVYWPRIRSSTPKLCLPVISSHKHRYVNRLARTFQVSSLTVPYGFCDTVTRTLGIQLQLGPNDVFDGGY